MAKSFLNSANVSFGLRNNNPGNLVSGINWQGLIGTNGGFCVFENIAYGIRALAMDIRTDFSQGQNTVRELISEFAPASDPRNPTNDYIKYVSAALRVNPDTALQFDRATLQGLIRAIMNYENGVNNSALITDQDINEGIDLMSGTIPPGAAAAGLGISAGILLLAVYLFATMRNP